MSPRRRDPLSQFSRAAYRAARLSRDVNAVRRGRIGNRLVNKMIGRLTGRLYRR